MQQRMCCVVGGYPTGMTSLSLFAVTASNVYLRVTALVDGWGGEAKTDQEAHMDNVILIAWSSKVERDVKQQVVSCCIKKVAKILVQNMHDNILHMFDYLLA